jgi:vacuolar-type H+-ATPase subunit I/STV1
MKTDLEILIEHLQSEYDYLKSSMDKCVAEWDFDGAKAFREPLIFTRRKLNILKSLKNPNFIKINRLAGMISRMEKSLTERKYNLEFLDEQTRQRMEERFNESTKKRIEESKTELKKLKSIEPKFRIDDDKILELIEGLERNEISEVEFEIEKDKIF